ncbi:MAG: hypothetical protein AAF711_05280 [Planctomycetota bacterium]
MTRREMTEHLRSQPFMPFRIHMNSGQTFEVRHPENVRLMVTDALYIFQPVPDEPGVDELITIASIHNICTIEKPIDTAA